MRDVEHVSKNVWTSTDFICLMNQVSWLDTIYLITSLLHHYTQWTLYRIALYFINVSEMKKISCSQSNIMRTMRANGKLCITITCIVLIGRGLIDLCCCSSGWVSDKAQHLFLLWVHIFDFPGWSHLSAANYRCVYPVSFLIALIILHPITVSSNMPISCSLRSWDTAGITRLVYLWLNHRWVPVIGISILLLAVLMYEIAETIHTIQQVGLCIDGNVFLPAWRASCVTISCCCSNLIILFDLPLQRKCAVSLWV